MKIPRKTILNTITQRGNVFWFKAKRNGYRDILYRGKLVKGPYYRCSLKTNKKWEAEVEAAKIHQLITAAPKIESESAPITLEELGLLYIESSMNSSKGKVRNRTVEWKHDQLKTLSENFGNDFIARKMNIQIANEGIQREKSKGISDTTIYQHRFKFLKSVYKFAHDTFPYEYPANPLNRLVIPKMPIRESYIATEKDYKAILKEINPYWSCFSFCLAITGLRLSDIRKLKVSNIKLRSRGDVINSITLESEDEKTRYGREVPIASVLAKYLTFWLNEFAPTKLAFPDSKGRMREPTCPGIKRAFKRCNRPDLVTHSFRHSWNTYMKKSGLFTEYEINYLAGWNGNATMQNRYNHMEQSDDFLFSMESRLSKVWNFLSPVVEAGILKTRLDKRLHNSKMNQGHNLGHSHIVPQKSVVPHKKNLQIHPKNDCI
jgi:integrase